jgi:DNA-binding NtrC family response regulator
MALNSDFAVCICDIHLPTRSGYDVFSELSSRKPDMQFLLTDSLPGHPPEKKHGGDRFRYLRKPFDLDQLRDILNQFLKPGGPIERSGGLADPVGGGIHNPGSIPSDS